jgi:hypothetical protein
MGGKLTVWCLARPVGDDICNAHQVTCVRWLAAARAYITFMQAHAASFLSWDTKRAVVVARHHHACNCTLQPVNIAAAKCLLSAMWHTCTHRC